MDHDGSVGWNSEDAGFGHDTGDGLGDPLAHGAGGEHPVGGADEPGLDDGTGPEGLSHHDLPDNQHDHEDGFGAEDTGAEPDGGHGLGLEYDDLGDGHHEHTEPVDTGVGDAGLADPGLHDQHDPGAEHADWAPAPEPVPGADPDVDHLGDDPTWTEDPFPPQLELGEPPEPVDGFPWSDPAVLGDAHDHDGELLPPAGPDTSTPPADDLLAYDAHEVPEGTDPWHALATSEDPATSSLARWWGPSTD